MFAKSIDLVTAMEADIDIDPLLTLEATTSDVDFARCGFCAECADELMVGVEEDLAADNAARRAKWLDEFAAVGAVAALDACLSRRYPVLARTAYFEELFGN
jgi:hypothetical protein